MNDLQKVLVVDDGDRSSEHSLSGELAENGFSSVTTSFDAAADVLQVIPHPSAIFLQMPNRQSVERYAAFAAFAERLRVSGPTASIPVFMVDHGLTAEAGGVASLLDRAFGSTPACTIEA